MHNDTSCEFVNHALYYSYNGDIRHCCIQSRIDDKSDTDLSGKDLQEFISTNSILKSISDDLNSGVKNDYCKKCWDIEDAGARSYRQNSFNIIRPTTSDSALEYIDLRLGNKCNLKCKMCFPAWSNQIHKHFILAKESGIANKFNVDLGPELYTESSHVEYLNRVLDTIIKTPSIKTLMLAGGEPFIMDEVEWFLSELVARGRSNLRLRISTNVTVVTDSMVDLLKKFSGVSLHCSIDGVEEDIEYQRHPCKWSVIESNFNKLYNSGLTTVLSPCFSQLNTLSVLKFLRWAGQYNKSRIVFNEVTDPSFLSFRLIPMEFRQELISELSSFELPSNADSNFLIFFENIKTACKQITDSEIQDLRAAVELWDFKSKITYTKKYPWGNILLNHDQ